MCMFLKGKPWKVHYEIVHILSHLFTYNSLLMIHPMPARQDRPGSDENNIPKVILENITLIDLQNQTLNLTWISCLADQPLQQTGCLLVLEYKEKESFYI